jgi:hypothetical protein
MAAERDVTCSQHPSNRGDECRDERLQEAIETVTLWVDLWVDEQSEIEEVSPCDEEERKVIAAVRRVLKAVRRS